MQRWTSLMSTHRVLGVLSSLTLLRARVEGLLGLFLREITRVCVWPAEGTGTGEDESAELRMNEPI